MEFLKKTVLITGGARGIGKYIALAFQREGYNVCITYNKSMADAMELKQIGFDTYKVDVTNEREIIECVNEVVSKYGRIDCLVNNAGISEIRLFTSITEERFKHMLDTNLTGAFSMSKNVIMKSMLHNKNGSIINISSIWGKSGGSCEVHYSASKAGLIGMTKALAKEMGPSNIRVNAVAPGYFWTPLQPACWEAEKIPTLGADAAMGSGAMPYQLAPTYVFLASNDSSYMTGQVVHVNGGQIMG